MADGTTIAGARASEARYRASVRDAVIPVLGTTPEREAWCEAVLEALWEHDGMTPFEVAMKAWKLGDSDMHDRAMRLEACVAAFEQADACPGPSPRIRTSSASQRPDVA